MVIIRETIKEGIFGSGKGRCVISAEVHGIKFAESLKVSKVTYACLKIAESSFQTGAYSL